MTLAVEDAHVRQVFANILHPSYLIPKYKEHELHIRSYKTIISVKESEVYELFLRYRNIGDYILWAYMSCHNKSDSPPGLNCEKIRPF